MNENGNKYAMAALKDKRATLAGEIVQYKRQIRAREKALAHLDQTIKLLSPDFDVADIKPKKAYARTRLFRQGELSRLTQDALRRAEGSLSSAEIVTAVMTGIEAPEDARPTMAPRVRGNLAYLQRSEKIVKIGSGTDARWMLANSNT